MNGTLQRRVLWRWPIREVPVDSLALAQLVNGSNGWLIDRSVKSDQKMITGWLQ